MRSIYCILCSMLFVTLLSATGVPDSISELPPDLDSLIGCADSLREGGEPDRAVKVYTTVLEHDETNDDAWTGLGKARYDLKEFDSSAAAFERARSHGGAQDCKSVYCFGTALGLLSRYEAAVEELGKHRDCSGNASMKQRLRARKLFYERKILHRAISEASAAESTFTTEGCSDSIVAVVNFQNNSGNPGWDPLEKGMADLVITDLSQVEAFDIVERTRMQMLIDELALDMTGVTENSERARVGRLVRASRLVGGVFDIKDSTQIRIRGGFFDVAAGKVAKTVTVTGGLDELFALEKKFVVALCDASGIILTEKERAAIQTIPTENLTAYMAYCRGIDAWDRGDYGVAATHFTDAAESDPGFGKSKEMAELSGAMEEIDALDKEYRKEPPGPGEEDNEKEGAENETEDTGDITAEENVDDKAVDETPVVYDGSGPSTIMEKETAREEPPAAQPQQSSGFTFRISAGTDVAHRSGSLAGAAFMPEKPLTQSSPDQDNQASLSESGTVSLEITNIQRPDYADYKNTGIGTTKQVPITVQIPD
ncbi:MAG: tetratricopeptide repeat protein [Chitinivibrionales bacterium]|nr:tetratricopeptide repeat protein [Chitinivibrionales bacterium]